MVTIVGSVASRSFPREVGNTAGGGSSAGCSVATGAGAAVVRTAGGSSFVTGSDAVGCGASVGVGEGADALGVQAESRKTASKPRVKSVFLFNSSSFSYILLISGIKKLCINMITFIHFSILD